jgi:hypothetical protein
MFTYREIHSMSKVGVDFEWREIDYERYRDGRKRMEER